MIGIAPHEIPVFRLCGIKGSALQPGRDPFGKGAGATQRGDIGSRHPSLDIVLREDRGAIACAFVGVLPVRLGWIVSHCEEYAQQVGIAYLSRIIDDPHGFGMTGGF